MPIVPISQIRKLTHREIKELAQGHSVNECPNQDSNQEEDSRAEVPKFCWTSALPPKAQCPRCTLTGRMHVGDSSPESPGILCGTALRPVLFVHREFGASLEAVTWLPGSETLSCLGDMCGCGVSSSPSGLHPDVGEGSTAGSTAGRS